MFFRIKDGVILRKRKCEFKQDVDILARTSGGDFFSLDSKLFNFLKHCNGKNNFSKLKTIYYRIFGKKLKFSETITSNNYLKRIVEYSKIKSPINKNQIIQVDQLEGSCRNAIWHLTNLCNLKCKHCYYIDKKTRKLFFLKKEIITIVENLHQLGVEKVVLTGGEPLLIGKKLKYLTDLLTDRCLFFTINTNAFEKVDHLLEIFKDNPYAESVQVSLDGDRELHEKFRGKNGCYSTICKHIKQLTSAGVKVKVVSMITKDWVGKERIFFEIIKDLGVKEWLIELPTRIGRWQDNYLRYGVSEHQLIKICKRFIYLIENKNSNLESFVIN